MNISVKDCEKVAVVIVGYNRLKPIQRLLSSLLRADYGGKEVPLVISVDCSNDEALYNYVCNINWPYGNKYVRIQEKRLGLKEHILQCGDLTQYFRAIILLEDDIYVGEYFYDYTLQALDAYDKDDIIGGISLYAHEMGAIGIPVSFYNDGSDTYLRQNVASWGECWTKVQWEKFKEWYNVFSDDDFDKIDLPESMKQWQSSWAKYYNAYLVDTKKYFVYPYLSHTTCFSDAGEHFGEMSMGGQVGLSMGSKKYFFKPVKEMVRYDIYWTNEEIYDWIGIPKEDICVDFFKIRNNSISYKYLLSPVKLPCPIMKSFGLFLRPIELNVKYNIDGDGLFLYDIAPKCEIKKKKSFSTSFIDYNIRSINFSLLYKYVIRQIIYRIRIKMKHHIHLIRIN